MKKLLLILFGLVPAALLGMPAAYAQSEAAALYVEQFPDTLGKTYEMKNLRGKPVLLNFWARWCGPCKQEIPDLVAAHEKYRGQGLVIVGVTLEDDREKVAEYAKAYEMKYPVVLAGLDAGTRLAKTLGNDKSAVPFSVLIDRNGRVVQTKLGVFKPGELDESLKKLF